MRTRVLLSILLLGSTASADPGGVGFARDLVRSQRPAHLGLVTKPISKKAAMAKVEAWRQEVSAQKAEHEAARDEALAELAKGESARAARDPRWFARWRDPAKNPVTVSLEEQVQEHTDVIAAKDRRIEAIDKIEARVGKASTVSARRAIADAIKSGPINGARSLEGDEAARVSSRTAAALEKLDAADVRYAEKKLGRELSSDLVSRLRDVARQGPRTFKTIVARVKEIDATELPRRGGTMDEALQVGLAELSVRHRVPAKVAVRIWSRIDRAGDRLHGSIDDGAVTVLAEHAIAVRGRDHGAAVALASSYHKVAARVDQEGWEMPTVEIARIASASVANGKSAEEREAFTDRVVKRFTEITALSETRKNLFIDDHTSVTMALATEAKGQPVKDSVDRFFAAYDVLVKALPKAVAPSDADVLRVATLAEAHGVSVERIGAELTALGGTVRDGAAGLVQKVAVGLETQRARGVALPASGALFTDAQRTTLVRVAPAGGVELARFVAGKAEYGWRSRSSSSSRGSSSSSSSSSSDSDLFSPTQYVITGNLVNLDNNPLTPF